MTDQMMLTDPTATARHQLTPQQRREEARRMYRESVDAELPMTDEALGAAFGRSARWGRDRIAEVRAEDRRPATGAVGMPHLDPANGHGRAGSNTTGKPRPVAHRGMPPSSRATPPAAAGMPADRSSGRARTGGVAAGRRRFVATALGVLAGVVAGAGTLAVAAAGFTLSFDAIRAVGEAAYIRPGWTWMLPVCVDGAMSVATVCAVVLRRLGRLPWYPWLVVLAGAGISIAANALHAFQQGGAVPLPAGWAMAVSGMPPLLLALSVHLLVILAVAWREVR